MQQLAGVVLGQAFPSFLAKCGFYTFYFFMGMNVLLCAMIYFFYLYSNGQSTREVKQRRKDLSISYNPIDKTLCIISLLAIKDG